MKIRSSYESGNVLLVSLIMSAIFGLSLVAYMELVSTQYRATSRSQAWNMALPVAEAGIEEALALLTMRGSTSSNMVNNGWTQSGSIWTRTRYIATNRYTIIFSNSAAALPDVYSVGSVLFPADNNWISRTVKLTIKKSGLLAGGMIAKGLITMNGNPVAVDSYDSSDPGFNSNGIYDFNKKKDNGNVLTILGTSGAIDLGNANIFGFAGVGPGGSATVGANGGIGSFIFQAANPGQIQTDRFRTDTVLDFPGVDVPFSSPWAPQNNVNVNGVRYAYYLASGNYGMSALDLKGQSAMYVAGNANLLVNDFISLGGQSQLIIAPGASLNIYVGGSVDFGGNGLLNSNGNPTNCLIFGLDTCTSITVAGNGTLTAVVYAPNADVSLRGSGNNVQDFSGALVGKTVGMNGTFKFHYDEALAKLTAVSHIQITGWVEVGNPQILP